MKPVDPRVQFLKQKAADVFGRILEGALDAGLEQAEEFVDDFSSRLKSTRKKVRRPKRNES